MGEFKSGFFVGGEACNGRVLVVDDEADIRKVVRMTLQKAGYEVLEAENGEKAIETINAGENRLLLDVMICDIRMPLESSPLDLVAANGVNVHLSTRRAMGH